MGTRAAGDPGISDACTLPDPSEYLGMTIVVMLEVNARYCCSRSASLVFDISFMNAEG